ncbi:MAG: glycosyltransferase family 2 protein [Chitinophagaceae bacterium]|nr:glycosyltransferase family 2 protein [Chitinophagaceae bacterium]
MLKQIFSNIKEVKPVLEIIPVTLIVTAYNEEQVLEEKIKNTQAINYPSEKLKIIFITDGSSDDTVKLVQQYPFIHLLHQPERKGKYAAVKRAMHFVTTPIVVFSDANTMLNVDCITKIASHYANPKTGGVAGEKKILRNKGVSAVGEAEGLYWQYESFMKKLDAAFNTVTGAAGELFSIRTALFKELDDELILDDFVISMQICLQEYKIEYEPEAFATELPSSSLKEEEKRKVRISAGAYQSIGYLKECLNIFKYPLLSFQYISRRLLRWIFCPVMLLILFMSNSLLVAQASPAIFYWTFYTQIIFLCFRCLRLADYSFGEKSGAFFNPLLFCIYELLSRKGICKIFKRKTIGTLGKIVAPGGGVGRMEFTS